jgi:hypothetical protein
LDGIVAGKLPFLINGVLNEEFSLDLEEFIAIRR